MAEVTVIDGITTISCTLPDAGSISWTPGTHVQEHLVEFGEEIVAALTPLLEKALQDGALAAQVNVCSTNPLFGLMLSLINGLDANGTFGDENLKINYSIGDYTNDETGFPQPLSSSELSAYSVAGVFFDELIPREYLDRNDEDASFEGELSATQPFSEQRAKKPGKNDPASD